jgi:hypothetical protein
MHAGGAAGQGDGVVAGVLEAAQHELGQEVADMERVARGIEPAIERDRAFVEALGQRFEVGAIGQKAAPLEVFDEAHGWIGREVVTACGAPRANKSLGRAMKIERTLLLGKTVCLMIGAAPTWPSQRRTVWPDGHPTTLIHTTMPIAVGSKAPDFTLKSKNAEGLRDVTLSANFGKKQTVLLFFPLAYTERLHAGTLRHHEPASATTRSSAPKSSPSASTARSPRKPGPTPTRSS